jgi:hypothetical protein
MSAMSHYWSLEDCCWVEHVSATPVMSRPASTSEMESEAEVFEQIPVQPTATPQQAPSLL